MPTDLGVYELTRKLYSDTLAFSGPQLTSKQGCLSPSLTRWTEPYTTQPGTMAKATPSEG